MNLNELYQSGLGTNHEAGLQAVFNAGRNQALQEATLEAQRVQQKQADTEGVERKSRAERMHKAIDEFNAEEAAKDAG